MLTNELCKYDVFLCWIHRKTTNIKLKYLRRKRQKDANGEKKTINISLTFSVSAPTTWISLFASSFLTASSCSWAASLALRSSTWEDVPFNFSRPFSRRTMLACSSSCLWFKRFYTTKSHTATITLCVSVSFPFPSKTLESWLNYMRFPRFCLSISKQISQTPADDFFQTLIYRHAMEHETPLYSTVNISSNIKSDRARFREQQILIDIDGIRMRK